MYILMLSSGTSVAERIRCYVSGADQHMGKPVSLPELALFVNNIARRLNLGRESFVPLSLNIVCLQLNGPVGTLPLSPSEMLLLKCLAEAPDRQLPYWYLQERLELDLDEKSKRSLEVRISRLKKKLHCVGASVPAIKSLWKEGYRLCLPVRIQA